MRQKLGHPLFLVCALLLLSIAQVTTLFAQTADATAADMTRGPVMIIPIKDEIDSGLSFFLQRMLRRAERDKFTAVVLEINSNGGLVTSAQEMKDALKASPILTIAYVKGRALSAAALIAISCHKIVMEPGSEMGAATPIKLLGTGVQAAEAKFVSAFKGEFESAAEFRRRPKALAGAMVDKDHDSIPGLVKRGEILTLTTETAAQYGYCDHIVSSLESAFRRLNIEPQPLERVDPTSGELIARWLTNPNVSVILFTIGFWSLILEFLVFGWGLLGWFGLCCLGLFFGGHLFAYLAGLEALLLFSIGAILLMVELLIIPGFGLTGVAGIACLSASIVIVFGGFQTAAYALTKIVALSTVMLIALYNLAPRLKLFDRFILKDQMTTAEGFIAVDMTQYNHLLHLEGIALSQLRPSGIVRIGSDRFEVVSDGGYIERNARVQVIAVEGQKIVVRSINS